MGETSVSLVGASSPVEELAIEGETDESWEMEEEARDVVPGECCEIHSERWSCSPIVSIESSGTSAMISVGGMCLEIPLTITNAKASQNEGVCLHMGYLNDPSARLALSLNMLTFGTHSQTH